jgi:hypothetical protein
LQEKSHEESPHEVGGKEGDEAHANGNQELRPALEEVAKVGGVLNSHVHQEYSQDRQRDQLEQTHGGPAEKSQQAINAADEVA